MKYPTYYPDVSRTTCTYILQYSLGRKKKKKCPQNPLSPFWEHQYHTLVGRCRHNSLFVLRSRAAYETRAAFIRQRDELRGRDELFFRPSAPHMISTPPKGGRQNKKHTRHQPPFSAHFPYILYDLIDVYVYRNKRQ